MTDPHQPPQPSSTPGGEPAPGPQGSEQPQDPSQPASGYGQQSGTQPGYQQPGPQPGYQQPGYQQSGYQQAGYPPAGYQQPGYPAPYPPDPPGRTMGIVGFVLAFVLAPAGIVVSAMALSESKKAGVDNPLGTWGLWLSIIFTALAVLAVLAYILFFVVMFGAMVSTTTGVY